MAIIVKLEKVSHIIGAKWMLVLLLKITAFASVVWLHLILPTDVPHFPAGLLSPPSCIVHGSQPHRIQSVSACSAWVPSLCLSFPTQPDQQPPSPPHSSKCPHHLESGLCGANLDSPRRCKSVRVLVIIILASVPCALAGTL